jgi:hypothetical protein
MMTAYVLSRTPAIVGRDHIEKNAINGTFSSHWRKNIHTGVPRIAGNTSQGVPRLRETVDNTERYI